MAQRGNEAFSVTRTSEEKIDDFYNKQGSEPQQAIPYTPVITEVPAAEAPSNPVSTPSAVTPVLRNKAPLPAVIEDIPADSAETATRTRNTGGKVGATLLAIALAAGAAKFVADNWPQHSQANTAKPHLLPQPNASTPDSEIIAIGPDGNTGAGITGTAPTETATPTVSASGTRPTPATSTPAETKTPNAPASTAPTKQGVTKVLPPVVVPRTSTPSASQHSAPVPQPSPSSPEKHTPKLDTAPNQSAIAALSDAVNEQQVSDLESSYQNVGDYLQAPDSGALDFLNKNGVSAFQQGPLLNVFSNAAASQLLGNKGVMTAENLRASGNPAAQVVAFTDNARNHTNDLRSSVGNDIVNIAYANPALASDLIARINNGEDVSLGDSNNEAIVGKVRKVHGVAVVPVIASYSRYFDNYTVFRWEALVPVNRAGGFVATTVFEKQLQAETYTAPPDTSDPTPTDTSTPTPSDTLLSEHNTRGHGHHKPNRD